MQLFIYGTLKRGLCRHASIASQTFLGDVQTEPLYRMYNVGTYPGLVRAENGLAIEGELWEVDEACLKMLDEIEDVARGLYLRQRVKLAPPHAGDHVEAYILQQGVATLTDCGPRWD